MKKIISVMAAAVCLVTAAAFSACGEGENEEPEKAGDVVSAEVWEAAFSYEKLANVTADRTYNHESSSSNNQQGWCRAVYLDDEEYYNDDIKETVSSTTKLDLEYKTGEYTNRDISYSTDIFDGNAYNESIYTYEHKQDYNYADVEVMKSQLGEDYYDWDYYAERCADINETTTENCSYIDYMQYVGAESSAFGYNVYAAEQETVDSVASDWTYSSYGCDALNMALGTYYSAIEVNYYSNFGISYLLYGTADYFNNAFEYDEESGTYVNTYLVETDVYPDYEWATAATYSGIEYDYYEYYCRKIYVKINDGYLTSIKVVTDSYYDLTTSNGFYDSYKLTSTETFKYYDYGTTVVTIPDEICTELDKLK